MFGIGYQYFVAVAKTGSFHKAADLCYVSQPAVSRQIQLLEERLGYKLFTRTTRTVTLTPAGRLLFHSLSTCETEIENCLKRIDSFHREKNVTGVLRIGLTHGWSPLLFKLPYFETFQLNYPDVRIELESHTVGTLHQLLREKKLDIIIINVSSLDETANYNVSILGTYNYMFVVSKKHPYAIAGFLPERIMELNFYMPRYDFQTVVDRIKGIQNTFNHPIPDEQIIFNPNINSVILNVGMGSGFATFLTCSELVYYPGIRAYPSNMLANIILVSDGTQNNDLTQLFLKHITLMNNRQQFIEKQ